MPDRLPLTIYAAHLPRHPEVVDIDRRYDRALCRTCYGTGVTAHEREVARCEEEGRAVGEVAATDAHCRVGVVYCGRHRCKECQGDGVVCPHCRGTRWLTEAYVAGSGELVVPRRCPTCTEGNNVNVAKEMRAIQFWLRRHCADCGAIRSRAQMTLPNGSWSPCPDCGSHETLLDVMLRESKAGRTTGGGER